MCAKKKFCIKVKGYNKDKDEDKNEDEDEFPDGAQSRCLLARCVSWAATKLKIRIITRIIIPMAKQEVRCWSCSTVKKLMLQTIMGRTIGSRMGK